MIEQAFKTKEAWIDFFNSVETPILRQTIRRLEDLRQSKDRLVGHDIALIVLQDPLLTAKVLTAIQRFRKNSLHSDITTIDNAIMMIGVEPFFERFESLVAIETMLKGESQALLGVLSVIRRAQRAAHYAHAWAFERHDMNVEEIELAALLHDLAEILLWCFAPKLAIEIRQIQQASPFMRSVTAQLQVLGISLSDLQLALCEVWHLPELLKTLIDDASAKHARDLNVILAVNLARHSGNNWNNPLLKEDFRAIESLLRVDRKGVFDRLGIHEDPASGLLVPSPMGHCSTRRFLLAPKRRSGLTTDWSI